MQYEQPLLMLLLLLWAATAALCAFATRTHWLDAREGLRFSWGRTAAFIFILAISTVTVLTAVLTRSRPELSGPAVTKPVLPLETAKRPELQRKQTEINQTEQQLTDVTRQIKQMQARAAILQQRLLDLQSQYREAEGKPAPSLNLEQLVEQINRPALLVLALTVLIVALVSAVLFSMSGSRQSWPWSQSTKEAEDLASEIDAMGEMVWQKRYREALQKAADISERKLRPLDHLDFLSLRGYSALQMVAFPDQGETAANRSEMITAAVKDLEHVVDQAPKRSEAIYVLAVAYGLADKHAEALAMFERARPALASAKLPFDYNESACHLKLAEKHLVNGDTAMAETHFSRVTALNELAGSVVQTRLRIGMINLRVALGNQDVDSAAAALQKVASIANIGEEQRLQLAVIDSALKVQLALRQGDVVKALSEATAFIAAHLPADLPAVDDDVADGAFSPLLDDDLKIPRDVFLGILLIQAAARSRLGAQEGTTVNESQVYTFAEPLLRALQFVPRHREVLGALGGLYYWFRPDKRDKAREWLEAATVMGVQSRIVRSILEGDRQMQTEHREALDWFRSASIRFLRDPMIAREVRRAVIEELGRFQDFAPMLVDKGADRDRARGAHDRHHPRARALPIGARRHRCPPWTDGARRASAQAS
jgi:hypothetical protein